MNTLATNFVTRSAKVLRDRLVKKYVIVEDRLFEDELNVVRQ
jgi:hypothetical protein